ncbi:hypothetical protein [Streptomyces hirsutus]|uniref:hypothetical protein n=1 Tax=Streptomyces hirsutus TaxID=35620 RepID=UPI00331BD28E
MADEQYRWLNRETAERLLNGESPEAVGPADRDQAERLSSALGALSAPPPPAGGELPGEAAALAAFRKVREERTGRAAGAVSAVPVAPRAGAAQGTDVGLVRIGAPSADRSGTGRAPRWARPVRFGLAAALTVGMVGGAAVLAGIGVLPTPSGVSGPAATATATATGPPERPLPPHPSEKDAPGGVAPGEEQGEPSGDADGDTGRQDGPGTGADEDGGLAETGVKTGGLGAGNGRGKQIASACRALRDGRKLPGNRRRLLEGAAGGPAQVGPYCENVLAHHGTGADTGTGSGPDSGPTTKRDGDDDTGNGRSDNGNGNGNGSNEGAANGNAGDGGSANGNGSNGNGSNGNTGNGNAGNGKGNANGNKGNSGQGNGQGGRGNGGKHGKGADASG